MANSPVAKMPAFIRLARLLDTGLFEQTPSEAFKALIPDNDQDWMHLFESARNNRAIAPLAFLFAKKPAFADLLNPEELDALTEWHELLASRTQAIQMQLAEFAGLYHQNNQDLLLLKGASRLFDDLYPDPSCRYFVDMDPMVKNADLFYQSFDLGYDLLADAAYDLEAVRDGDLSCAFAPNLHHLPPLYREGDQVGIELHLYPFARSQDDLAIADLWQNSQAVPDVPGLRLPSLPHQLIINIVHTLLHGLGREQYSISIRDLFEGHLLYQSATPDQRAAVRAHFDTRGYQSDFELWLSVCNKVFEHPIYQHRETRFQNQFFERAVVVQADPAARFKYRLRSKIRNFIVHELTNRHRLKLRIRHLMSAAFWKRVSNSVRNARSERQ